MRVLMLSDIHDRFALVPPDTLPSADLCLLAGDLTNYGKRSRYNPLPTTEAWLAALGQRYPTFWIPGNHDIGIGVDTLRSLRNVTCLLDRTVRWNGLTLHGVSLSPCYDRPRLAHDWDYMTTDRAQENRTYDFEAVDIVVSHSPPLGVCDLAQSRAMPEPRPIGSEALRDYIERHQPKLVVCGHVHEAQGTELLGVTRVVNAAELILTLELSL